MITQFRKNCKGSSMIFISLLLVTVLSFSALAVDFGYLVYQKDKLRNAVDAATRAGALELMQNPANAETVALSYLEKNLEDISNIDIIIDIDSKTIEVIASNDINLFFAKIFNKNQKNIAVNAKAQIQTITGLDGVKPIAIADQPLDFGIIYTLKEGGGSGTTGNYGAVSFGETGASAYLEYLINGYDDTIRIGDVIQTEPGNMSGSTQTGVSTLIDQCEHEPECTYNNYVKGCPRILFIPVVETLDVNGRSNTSVVNFATFFLEGSTGSGNEADINGRFIHYVAEGESSQGTSDYGLYNIKMIN